MNKTAFTKGYQNRGINDNTATVILGFLAKQAGLEIPQEEVQQVLDTPMDKTANEDIRKALFIEGYCMDKEAGILPMIHGGITASGILPTIGVGSLSGLGGGSLSGWGGSSAPQPNAPDEPADSPWYEQAWDWATKDPWHMAGVLGGGGALAYYLLKQKQDRERAMMGGYPGGF
jgi:hypothetical protein